MSPGDEYARRLDLREARVRRLDALAGRLGTVRLILAAAAVAIAWEAWHRHALSPLWLLVPIAAFTGVAIYHSTVRRARRKAERAAAFYRGGLERLQDRWAGRGAAGERFDDPHHVYAADLDLFGKGGLFELLCAARTRMGEETLAGWLRAPAAAGEIRERHASVEDLRDRLDLRENIAVLGEDSGPTVHPQALLAWAESPNVLEQPWVRWAARGLPVLCAASAVVWGTLGLLSPFVVIVCIELAVLYRLRGALDEALDATEHAFDDLKTFAGLLARIEREPVRAPALQALVRSLSQQAGQAMPAARSIGKLGTLAELAGSRENMIVQALSVPVLYSLNVALAAERWRAAHGLKARAWVDAAGRFEALSSLAQYGFERPDDPFPELVDEGAPCFEAAGLGHPLIPSAQCVRNDVRICGCTRVLLVSGSNMSGKSTLLRAAGMNTVLAMAGAPVCAQSLRLTPLAVGASIRIGDSLAEGSSHFYAEITRLKQLYDLADGARPLLFLLDEVLQGTNSKDRRAGAEAIVRAFVRRGAIGILSTHDLALTEIEGVESGTLRNVHFEDQVRDGRMAFDFKLREGVVAQSNGLELMRSIGLDV
ncbi:MAG: MutS-related protein [Steroidobacteraceae bacterium]